MSTPTRNRVPAQYVDKDRALAEYDKVLAEQRGVRNAAAGNTIGNVLGNTATMGLGLNPIADLLVGYGVGEIGSKIGAGDTDKRIAERMAAVGYEGDTDQRHRAGSNLISATVPNIVGPLGLPIAALGLSHATKKGWIRPEADSARTTTIIGAVAPGAKEYQVAKPGASVREKILKSRTLYEMAHPTRRTLYTGLGLGAGLSLAAGYPLSRYLERKGYERNRARIARGIDEQNARFQAAGGVIPKTSSMNKESIMGALQSSRTAFLFPAVRNGKISPHATGIKHLPMVADSFFTTGPAWFGSTLAAGADPLTALGAYGVGVTGDAIITYLGGRAGAMARAGIKPSEKTMRYVQPVVNAAQRTQQAFNASPARYLLLPVKFTQNVAEGIAGGLWRGAKAVADTAVNSRFGIQRISPRVANSLNDNPLTRSLKRLTVDETVGMGPSLAKNSQLDKALLAAYNRASSYAL